MQSTVVRRRWRQKLRPVLFAAQEDRRWRLWRDLRSLGPADAGERGPEGGISAATQASAEDGGGGAEETAG